ncbi:glutamate racemase [Litchfieldella qijiaojingensis]|uniref:Glutamate racemase n=1 Tax=Litchfieldella qijiaojingensis TaxID=980347 RepID=A0ABQ2Z9H1_9GAMM|nr:glutamate racemase [Halomonas qijiaojingensis]GGY05438.1 glutamate racemase [Halomonas qijiaojingensis]
MSGPILIFDSGVGGLSVVAAMRRRLPEAALAYVCDDGMLPYGTKNDDWLVARIVAVCEAAVRESGACALVVACNTASTLALDALRARITVPVVGTVPAIKPAARLSRSRHLALLATSATVNRPYTQALIADFAADCQVLRLAADPLVEQAERLLTGNAVDRHVVADCLAPLWDDAELDTVVLGCTHFPLLREVLEAVAQWPITWVDSGDAIARRVAQVVVEPAPLVGPGPGWVTGSRARLAPVLARYGFAMPRHLDVPLPGRQSVPIPDDSSTFH